MPTIDHDDETVVEMAPADHISAGEDDEPVECCYCGNQPTFKHVATNGAVWFTCGGTECKDAGEPA